MQPLQTRDLRDPRVLLATWFGAGLMRPGPGTWGSLLAAVQALLVCLLFDATVAAWVLRVACLLCLILGWICIPAVTRRVGLHDPGAIVIDEAAGIFAALSLFPPVYLSDHPLATVGACLLLFRILDIAKPPPVDSIERLPGSGGVLADDLVAGLLAGVCAFAFVP